MGVRHIESTFRQHSGGSLGKREGYHTPAFEEDGRMGFMRDGMYYYYYYLMGGFSVRYPSAAYW